MALGAKVHNPEMQMRERRSMPFMSALGPRILAVAFGSAALVVTSTPPALAGPGPWAADVSVTQADPDLSVVAHDDIDIPRGRHVVADFFLGNNDQPVSDPSPQPPTPSAVLSLVLPAGVRVGSGGVRDTTLDRELPCSPAVGNTWTCQVAPADTSRRNVVLAVDLVAGSDAVPGLTTGLKVTVEPDGAQDRHPTDNAITIPLRIFGNAHLTYRISFPSRHRSFDAFGRIAIARGETLRVDVSITNHGPDSITSASLTYGDFLTVDRYLAISELDGTRWHHRRPFLTEQIGTMGPGETVTRSVLVTGLKVTPARVLQGGSFVLSAIGYAFDPEANCLLTRCRQRHAVEIRVVNPASAPAHDVTGPVANTGSATGSHLLLAAMLLLVGGVALVGGRRPRRR